MADRDTAMEPFSFGSSSKLKLAVSVRINNLDGYQKPIPFSTLLKRPDLRHVGSNVSPFSDMNVTCQLWADSKPLAPALQTAYKAFKNSRTWNEWLTFPIHYATLPRSAQLAITIWDLSPTGGPGAIGHSIPFGGTTVPLFGEDSTLLRGRQRCHVHRHKAADGLSLTTTPYTLSQTRRTAKKNDRDVDPEDAELERLTEMMKEYEMGEIPKVAWLDQMVFREVERLEHKHAKKLNTTPNRGARRKSSAETSKQNGVSVTEFEHDPGQFFLYIDLPRFDHPIVFTDHQYPAPPISSLLPRKTNPADIQLKPPPEVTLGPGINEDDSEGGRLIRIYDPEVGYKDNPVETKHRRLVRNSDRAGAADRDAKPSQKERNNLDAILAYGPGQELSVSDKDLVWKFRHHLTRNKRALTKFVKSVSWADAREVRQAVHLLPQWTEIDVDDALELLGPGVENQEVRAYAVDRLRKADDDELLVYLLQLVQALKFEKPGADNVEDAAKDSSLARFLISRATSSLHLGNFFHWYLMVECDDSGPGGNPVYRKLFAKVEYDFMASLASSPEGESRRRILLRQGELVTVLSKISLDIRTSKESRPRKIEQLRKLLADPANELLSISPPLPLPIDPSIRVTGVFPDDGNVFKSSLFPLLVHFRTAAGEHYPIIFKTGDDLRQDQLVMQIIMLMDRLLRKENLDLRLTPYHILATSPAAGAVEFVPSMALAAILAKHRGSIQAYLRAHNGDERAEFGVRREAMDNYVRSCAGYCVITYLLGVGDRHLDNLLLAPDGRFFHIDFGYILGRDPKPFAPLMKLSKEMIDGMGGAQSRHYREFKQHCFTAYTTLRKSSNLILNLFSLMVDANIPDIRMEPDKAVGKVRERFHLELRTEEEVIRMFEGLMEDSVSAMFPAIIDWTHKIVQGFRA